MSKEIRWSGIMGRVITFVGMVLWINYVVYLPWPSWIVTPGSPDLGLIFYALATAGVPVIATPLAVGAELTTTMVAVAGAPGEVPVAATGVTSNVSVVPRSARTTAYVVAVAPPIGVPLRSQRKVELPSASPSTSP